MVLTTTKTIQFHSKVVKTKQRNTTQQLGPNSTNTNRTMAEQDLMQEETLVDYEADEEEDEEDASSSIDRVAEKEIKQAQERTTLKKRKQDEALHQALHEDGNAKHVQRIRKDDSIRRSGAAARSNARVSSGSAAHGVYIPPFKRRQMEEQKRKEEAEAARQEEGEVDAKDGADMAVSIHEQRQKWEDLKKAINGTINRLNSKTIKDLIHALFQNANLIRGKGLLAKSVLRAATTSPTYAPVYASLVAVLNTKLPEIGELVLVRSILVFRKSYARQDRSLTMSIINFIGCLFNQGLCHELLCLQLLTVLLDGDPTDDSVDVAVQLTKVVGMALTEISPAGIHAVMERFRNLLHDGSVNRRVQYKIEELMKIRKKRFKDYPTLVEELDLVERDEQIMFEIGLDDEGLNKEDGLDVFAYDENYTENENDWIAIQKEILGGDSDDDENSDGSDDETDDDDDDDSDDDSDDDEDGVLVEAPVVSKAAASKEVVIHDMTEKDLINLRRKIYLTIMSSATFEECAHKLAKLSIPEGKEMELINMIIECCSQERTFLRYYGLIASRFCLLHQRWTEAFLEAFGAQYSTIHRLETNKLRNVAKLFAHLLHTDSLPWSCLSIIHLNEDETTSSSRIFLKILVQEMAEALGIGGLVKRFESDDPEVIEWYKEMFPKDNPRKTRYAINFFTSIGLGPLTDGLREHLKNAPKLIMQQAQEEAKRRALEEASDDSSSVSSTSSSSTSSMSSESSSSSDSSDYSSTSSSDYSSSSDESSLSDRKSKRSRSRKSSGGSKNRSKRARSYSSTDSESVVEEKTRKTKEGKGKLESKRNKRRRSRSSSYSS